MVLFSFFAGLLAGVAATLFGPRLWRTASALAPGRVRYQLIAGAVASFALIAGIIYVTIGSRHAPGHQTVSGAAPAAMGTANAGSPSGPAKSMQDAVAGLEARLAKDGGSAGDWTLLAQAYEFMGRPDDAKRARAASSPQGYHRRGQDGPRDLQPHPAWTSQGRRRSRPRRLRHPLLQAQRHSPSDARSGGASRS